MFETEISNYFNTNPGISVVLDWGEGSPTQTVIDQGLPGSGGPGELVSHIYEGGIYTITITQNVGGTLVVDQRPIIVCFDANLDLTSTQNCQFTSINASLISLHPNTTYTWAIDGVTILTGPATTASSLSNYTITNYNSYLMPVNEVTLSLTETTCGASTVTTELIPLSTTEGIFIGSQNTITNLSGLITAGLFTGSTIDGDDPALSSPSNRADIYVEGVLSLNTTGVITISNCDFKMSPGSGLDVIRPNGSIISPVNRNFNNCSFQASCGVMWRGIQVLNRTRLTINNTAGTRQVLSDAHFGVHVPRTATNQVGITLNYVDFRNNYVGLYVAAPTGLLPGLNARNVSNIIRDNFFQNPNPLLPNYISQPNTGNFAFAGAVLEGISNSFNFDDTDGITGGSGGNFFSSLKNGLLASNVANLRIRNTAFYNIGSNMVNHTHFNINPAIYVLPGATADIDGFGVFHTNNGLNGNLTFLGMKDIAGYGSVMVNVKNGIYFNRAGSNISNADFVYRLNAATNNSWADPNINAPLPANKLNTGIRCGSIATNATQSILIDSCFLGSAFIDVLGDQGYEIGINLSQIDQAASTIISDCRTTSRLASLNASSTIPVGAG